MTQKHHDEPKPSPDLPYVTRADLKAEAKPTEPPKKVKLKAPSGAKIETAEDNADTLRDAGYT